MPLWPKQYITTHNEKKVMTVPGSHEAWTQKSETDTIRHNMDTGTQKS